MPTLVPAESIVVSRPTDRKDKEGNPVHQALRVQPGQPFDFTDAEAEDIRRMHPLNPDILREPTNETAQEGVEGEVSAAATMARTTATAEADAASVARTGARGRGARRQPANPHASEAVDEDEQKEDEEL